MYHCYILSKKFTFHGIFPNMSRNLIRWNYTILYSVFSIRNIIHRYFNSRYISIYIYLYLKVPVPDITPVNASLRYLQIPIQNWRFLQFSSMRCLSPSSPFSQLCTSWSWFCAAMFFWCRWCFPLVETILWWDSDDLPMSRPSIFHFSDVISQDFIFTSREYLNTR